MSWEPRRKGREILVRGLHHVNSVPYRASTRWLYYRLLDERWYSRKSDYKRFMDLTSKARKNFWNGWDPDTLVDETREAIIGDGDGFEDADAWIGHLGQDVECRLDKWFHQPAYIEIFFEARAMAGQFRFYAPDITLSPFGGDASIFFKRSIARRLSSRGDLYGVPVKVFYFGDADQKGDSIPRSAMADIRLWASVDIEFQYVGLTADQARDFGLPENPDKPSQWQWESLTDDQAASLIRSVVDLIDRVAWERVEEMEREATARFRELLNGALW